MAKTILVLNCGSSSVKFAVFSTVGPEPKRLWSGNVERIGLPESRFTVGNEAGTVIDDTYAVDSHAKALDLVLSWLEEITSPESLHAVGHRVVHGGNDCNCPLPVTPALLSQLAQLTPLAPLHLPHNVAGIEAIRVRRPNLSQFACFDTAFHHSLPRLARLTGLPRSVATGTSGIRRYGFHGLSYEYVIEDIRRREGERAAQGRIVVVHLGNGASMAGIHGGRSVETTMGFSTLAGLPMGTRVGDLDPGLLLYLLLEKQMTPEALHRLLYEQSGLLGLSGRSRNMVDLLAKPDDTAAAEAVDYFCYRARGYLARLTAALGGLDRVVFTGGIGAHAPLVRAGTLDGLAYLGIRLDARRNNQHRRVISTAASQVLVEAFETDEELMIARHTMRLARENKEKSHDLQ